MPRKKKVKIIDIGKWKKKNVEPPKPERTHQQEMIEDVFLGILLKNSPLRKPFAEVMGLRLDVDDTVPGPESESTDENEEE